jgi:signal transduction histidine kinase/ABC-type uncharacterized transport system substrate-binding protein
MKRIYSIPLAIAVWLLSIPPNLGNAAESQKSVLLIFDLRGELPSNVVVDTAIRRVLNDEFGFDLDIRSENFDDTITAKDFPVLLSWLRRKYAGKKFDVVIPVGASALRFVRDVGEELFPGAQILYWGRRAGMEVWPPDWPITAVVAPEMEAQLQGNIAFIRTLQPDLQRLIVVTGRSPLDASWETNARRELRPFESQIEVSYFTGLTLEDVQRRLAGLPSKTAVLMLSINEDGAGRRLLRSQYLSKLVEASAAPVYSTSAVYLDTGFVGGSLLDQETMAIEAGRVAVRLLHGEDIHNMPVQENRLVPMANWKALKRWGLREANLPPGTVVMYKEPSLLDMYRWHIIGVISLCLLEAVLIIALLVHRARRKRAERAMAVSKQQLQSAIDALSARVALLDQKGTIIAVNRRWKAFAEANPHERIHSNTGSSFLDDESISKSDETRMVSNGIQRVIAGELEDFRCVYPSVQNDVTSWFQVRVNRFDTFGEPRFVVTYEDVTEIKQAHDAQQQVTGLLMRAQDEERRRIARDLHDVTVQNMVAIKADLSGMERVSQDLSPRADEMLQEGMSLCDQVIRELRTLSYLLHPPFLDEAGLVPALQWFVRGFIERSGIKVELLVMDNIGRLPKEVETALFRVVQESLTNIHLHSGSRNAVIWVTKERHDIVLRIRDEGHGFSKPVQDGQEGTPALGVGIAGMRQRMRQLGGRLDIESSSQGTSVSARISISEDLNAAYLSSR